MAPPATPPLLALQDITLTLGGKPLLEGASLAVGPGERVCLVGRNGSGKSTLLRIAADLLAADTGTRFLQPGATLRYLPQEPDFGTHRSVLAYALAGLGPSDDAHRAEALLTALGLAHDADPSSLSGGEARRAALARTLAPAPDLLLLDEPTNHLDIAAIEWLEAELGGLSAGIVLISHDRRLLERLSRRVVWLDGGRTRQLDQGFARFEAWRDEVIEQEEREHHKLSREIAREEHWLRYGVTARRKRNMRRVGELAELRARFRAEQGRPEGAAMAAGEASLSGKLVAVLEGAGKSYDGRPIVRGLDLRLRRGDRLGIVGPNGAGKTTLLRLLTGTLAPDEGSVRLGTNLALVTLDQLRGSLDGAATLADTLTGGGGEMVAVGGEKRHVIGYMKDFLFRPEQARTPVARLSGGERGRLALAVALARPSNVLVLDEPTNDLDIETLDLLQDMLAAYAGTVLLVSHDRDFLDRVVTSTLAPEGDGRWTVYAGGYGDMMRQRRAEAPVTSARRGQAETRGGSEGRARPPAGKAAGRLTFKDQHTLANLPARMETLGAEAARLRRQLGDADFYRRDPAGFARATKMLGETEAALAAAEEEWLALEVRREALEGRTG